MKVILLCEVKDSSAGKKKKHNFILLTVEKYLLNNFKEVTLSLVGCGYYN